MARIAGVDIPREKRVVISLTYIYGIGTSTAQKILEEANVSADTRVKDLTDDELGRIREVVDGYKVEGDLRRETNFKYQTFNGNFIIPWYPSPSWFTSSWSKNEKQRAYS